jgi:hypothetical protein
MTVTRKQVRAFKQGSGHTPRRRSTPRRPTPRRRATKARAVRIVPVVVQPVVVHNYDVKVLVVQVVKE